MNKYMYKWFLQQKKNKLESIDFHYFVEMELISGSVILVSLIY